MNIIVVICCCLFKVYISYDYGKSFKRISHMFRHGNGNGDVATMEQFFHSPADNKRVS